MSTEMDFHAIKLKDVLVEGFDVERTSAVEAEVRTVLGPYEGVDFALKEPVELSVIITDRLEHHVDRITGENGSAPGYQRQRNAVTVAGIVVRVSTTPRLHLAMVVGHEPWMTNDGASTAGRVYTLAHELGHVVQQGTGKGLKWHEGKVEPRTHAQELRRLAALVLDEFDADMMANDVCKRTLRDDHDQPARCSDLFGQGFLEAAAELCRRLCECGMDVERYRVTAAGLDALLPKATSLLGELLVVLGHAVGVYAGDKTIEPLLAGLTPLPGFNAYVREHFPLFAEGLTEEDPILGQDKIIQSVEGMLGRLGLTVEDLPDGRCYLHVEDPVLCEGCAGAGDETAA